MVRRPQAGNLDFSGTFAKFSRIFRKISLALSRGSRMQTSTQPVFASLSGLRLLTLRLLGYNSGENPLCTARAGHGNIKASIR